MIGMIGQAPPSPMLAEDLPLLQIAMGEDYFHPVEANVAVGAPVLWINQCARPHTVQSFDRRFESGRMSPEDEFSLTFAEPGAYGYFCDYHPWMSGTITVTPRG